MTTFRLVLSLLGALVSVAISFGALLAANVGSLLLIFDHGDFTRNLGMMIGGYSLLVANLAVDRVFDALRGE